MKLLIEHEKDVAEAQARHVVIEVDWMLRESDGKLTHNGWRRVTRKPRQQMMVEVVDEKKGIQSDVMRRRCEHLLGLMNKRGVLKCVQGLLEDAPSAS